MRFIALDDLQMFAGGSLVYSIECLTSVYCNSMPVFLCAAPVFLALFFSACATSMKSYIGNNFVL